MCYSSSDKTDSTKFKYKNLTFEIYSKYPKFSFEVTDQQKTESPKDVTKVLKHCTWNEF